MASPASARAAHLHEEKNATGTRSGIPAAFFLPLNETADGMANDMPSAKDDKTILRVAALVGPSCLYYTRNNLFTFLVYGCTKCGNREQSVNN